MSDSDEMLYQRFLTEHRENDLRILLERHRESLTLFLYGMVHSMEDAEELMLDAFAEIVSGARFLGKSSFKTWLFSIGKKKALMLLRKQKNHAVSPEEAEAGASETPEFRILQEERKRELHRALGALKDEYRQILTLLYFEEMSFEEAGAVIGKSRKQAYNLAERGRKALRAELERMGFDNEGY